MVFPWYDYTCHPPLSSSSSFSGPPPSFFFINILFHLLLLLLLSPFLSLSLVYSDYFLAPVIIPIIINGIERTSDRERWREGL